MHCVLHLMNRPLRSCWLPVVPRLCPSGLDHPGRLKFTESRTFKSEPTLRTSRWARDRMPVAAFRQACLDAGLSKRTPTSWRVTYRDVRTANDWFKGPPDSAKMRRSTASFGPLTWRLTPIVHRTWESFPKTGSPRSLSGRASVRSRR
jgi:hypothetical protein